VRSRSRAGSALSGLVALVGVSLVTTLGSVGTDARALSSASVGVSRTTITVAGLVGTESTSTGAEVGAQARFARANRGGGVAGRTVSYAGNAVDATTASAEAFAVVPAVSDALDTTALARLALPFVGSATTTGWDGNRFGFGFVGAQAPLQTRSVSPAWGARLRSLLGRAESSTVALAVDDSELGAARAAQARASLHAAGFRVVTSVTVPAPPAPLPDLTPSAGMLATGAPAVALLLTSPAATLGLAQLLAQVGYVGTVATDASLYQPAAPSITEGMTVLVPYAPIEQSTAANRRLTADVERFAPGTKVTSGIMAGYWSADLFLRMLAATGRHPSRARFLEVARHFDYEVAATVGRSRWPAMHSQGVACGALVQSDGTEYVVAEPYACGKPVVVEHPARSTTTTTG
jgi:branched-chain amino acid transport system substrate-binding protein